MNKLVRRLKHWTLPVVASAALTTTGLFGLHEINPTGAHWLLARDKVETTAPNQSKRINPNLFAEREHLIDWAKNENASGELKAENGKLGEFIVRASTIQEALNEGYNEDQYHRLLTTNLTLLNEHRARFADLPLIMKIAPKTAIDDLKTKSLTGVEYLAAERNSLNLLRGLNIGNCHSIWLHQLAVSPVDLKSEVYADHVHTARVVKGKVVNAYPNPENKRGDLYDSASLLIKGLEKTQERETTTGEVSTDAFVLPLTKKKFRSTRNPEYAEKLLAPNNAKRHSSGQDKKPVYSIMQLRNYPLALGDITNSKLAGKFYRIDNYDNEKDYDYTQYPPLSPIDVIKDVAKALEVIRSNKEKQLKRYKPGTIGHKDVLDTNGQMLGGAKDALHFTLGEVILSKDPKTRALRPVQVALLKQVETEIQEQKKLRVNHYKAVLERDPLNTYALDELKKRAPNDAEKYERAYAQKAKEFVEAINAGRVSYDKLPIYDAIPPEFTKQLQDPFIQISLTSPTTENVTTPHLREVARKLFDAQATFTQIEVNTKAWADFEEVDKLQNLDELQKHEAILAKLNVPNSGYFVYLKQRALAQVKKIKRTIAKASQN